MEEEVKEEAQWLWENGRTEEEGGGVCFLPHLRLPSSHSHVRLIFASAPPSFTILRFLTLDYTHTHTCTHTTEHTCVFF